MPSIAIAMLKRLLKARLNRADEGQDLLEYAAPHGAHRSLRHGRRVDGR